MKQLNLSFVIQELDSDESAVIEMLGIFKKMIDDYISRMEHALRDENYDQMFYESHKIISPCTMLGLRDLAKSVANIERLAKNHEINEIRLYYRKVKNLIDQLVVEIEEVINVDLA